MTQKEVPCKIIRHHKADLQDFTTKFCNQISPQQ